MTLAEEVRNMFSNISDPAVGTVLINETPKRCEITAQVIRLAQSGIDDTNIWAILKAQFGTYFDRDCDTLDFLLYSSLFGAQLYRGLWKNNVLYELADAPKETIFDALARLGRLTGVYSLIVKLSAGQIYSELRKSPLRIGGRRYGFDDIRSEARTLAEVMFGKGVFSPPRKKVLVQLYEVPAGPALLQ